MKQTLTQTTVAGMLWMVYGKVALILTASAMFLGADGQWMLGTLRTFIRKLRPAPVAEPAAAVPVE